MDKKINEKDFLPGQQLPIEIMHVKDAWFDMQKRLEDEMPPAAIGSQYPAVKEKSSLQKRILRISLLLLLLLVTLFFINQVNKQQESSKGIAGSKGSSIDDKQSTNIKPGKESLPDNKSQTSTAKSISEDEKKKTIGQQETIDPNNFVGKDKQQTNDLKKKNVSVKKKNTTYKPGSRSVKKAKNRKSSFANSGNNNTKEIISDKNSNEKQTIIDDVSAEKNSTINNAIDTASKNDLLKDSTEIKTPDTEDEAPQYKPIISAGLQWNFQLPVYSADNYFKGSAATSQAYRVLLPGAWISVQSGKHLLRAEANPFYSNLLPPKPFGTFTAYSNVPDTIITMTETKTLRKTFGIFVSADYNYNFSSNWWVGGIHAYWQRKGITSGSGTEERRSLINGGVVINNFNRSYVLTKTEWENFARFQLGIHAEAFYSSKKMQTGLRIGLPVTNIAKHQGQKSSIRSEVIFRLPLFFSDSKK